MFFYFTCQLVSVVRSGSSHNAGPESLPAGPACESYKQTTTNKPTTKKKAFQSGRHVVTRPAEGSTAQTSRVHSFTESYI